MPDTLSQCGSKPSGFFCLPLEIREEIYFHLLSHSAIFVQYLNFEVYTWMWEDPERKTGILSVSRQISEEALNVLYGRNLFIVTVHGGAHNKLLKFGNANLRRIRYLRLVAQPMGICFPKPVQFDSQLWIPLLTGLSQLCLVAQQPLQARSYYNAPSFEEDMQRWIAWLEPILRYLAQNISEKTSVKVDDNKLVETGDVIQKHFRSGYERVQTATGDHIFMRGMFSWESGYWDDDDGGADGGMGDDWSD